jgi:hypothetical protein
MCRIGGADYDEKRRGLAHTTAGRREMQDDARRKWNKRSQSDQKKKIRGERGNESDGY